MKQSMLKKPMVDMFTIFSYSTIFKALLQQPKGRRGDSGDSCFNLRSIERSLVQVGGHCL